MKKYLPFLFLFFLSLVFFWKFFINGLIPVPSDTIVGLYHPYRDLYAKDYPRGIPFKNFLITDPVRQIYPWKELAISQFKNYSIPIWNPYEMAGRPLLANFQSAVFYPFNILFFIVPFWLSWSFLIMIQPLLGSIFMFLFLRNLKLDIFSSFFGGVVFAFSGFFVTWLEWGNVLHTALWLPLILLSIDKIFQHSKEISNIKNKKFFVWFGILLFSSLASFFGGHLQIFFYVSIVTALYFIFRLYKQSKKFNILFVFLIFSILFLILTSIQWIPTLQFVLLSARGLDQGFLDVEGWFIPWQHLVQFIAPDFFGNPTTLNYWGTWNYGELTGYFGIIPLLFAIFAIFIKKNKEVLFFAFVAILALIFALPTPLAKIPFLLNLPLISTSQPTRLLFLVNFSLAVLSAFGLNYYSNILKNIRIGEKKLVLFSLGLVGIGIAALYVFTIVGIKSGIDPTNLAVAKRNSILPLAIFIASLVLILGSMRINKKFTNVILALLILITIFDLFRFSWKFNTFSK
ncbi:MAG: YfhO family protein, partial [Candidatus Levybacteria bacterium]|nr:YfhO family protein [Candidatus Levybacteria bacterium]